MSTVRWAASALAAFILLTPCRSQQRPDPLTQAEIDQLRDTAWEPEQRLKFYVKFARARLDAVDKVRSDPKVKDHGQEMHDKLEDFLNVYDELDQNIDTYEGRRSDIRKALKTVIEADTEFQSRLRALKDSATAAPDEVKHYEFLLANAVEAVDTSAQDHRQLLADQEEAAKHKKKDRSAR